MSVSVSLAPGLEEDWSGAGVGLSDDINNSPGIRDDVMVDLKKNRNMMKLIKYMSYISSSKAWSLRLILDDHSVPVSSSTINH